MRSEHRSDRSRDVIVALVLFTLAALVAASFTLQQSRSAGPSSSAPPRTTPSARPAGTGSPAPGQPESPGFEYMLRREVYYVRASAGDPIEKQYRLRESWRASDGWSWARQTGDEPAQFIFAPDNHWTLLRDVPAAPRDLERRLGDALGGSTTAERDAALFDSVSGTLGGEALPEGALPPDSRRALVEMLARLPGVKVHPDARDPEGRSATAMVYRDGSVEPAMVETLYLDQGYEFLATEFTIAGTDERGSNVVVQRHRVDRVPDDLLTIVGNQRVEYAHWQCQDPRQHC